MRWLILMISGSNEQQQQQLKYTLLKPDCHNWWISKMQSECEEKWHAIKFSFKLGKKCHRNGIAFWKSCMNWASVFEWHKRFKEGRESMMGGVKKSIYQSWLAKGLGLGLLCWGF